MKFEFFRKIYEKKTEISNFILIRPLRADLFRADGWTDRQTDRRTDMTKLTVAFFLQFSEGA
jgi:hypothetical protein